MKNNESVFDNGLSEYALTNTIITRLEVSLYRLEISLPHYSESLANHINTNHNPHMPSVFICDRELLYLRLKTYWNRPNQIQTNNGE